MKRICLIFIIAVFTILLVFLLSPESGDYIYMNYCDSRDSAKTDFGNFLLSDHYFAQPEDDTFSFGKGWKLEKGKFAYLKDSEGEQSQIYLDLKKKAETAFTFRIKNYPGVPAQTVTALLNDIEIGKIEVNSSLRVISLTLPEKNIIIGKNILTLKYDRTTRKIVDEQKTEKSILLDWLHYDNYQLERGLRRGSFFLPYLATPANGKFEFDLEVPSDAVLDLYTSLIRLEDDELKSECRFQIIFRTEDTDIILLDITKKTSKNRSRRWRQSSIDLSGIEGKRGKLIFQTETNTDDSSHNPKMIPLWGSPVLYGNTEQNETPNILLISIDTLRADHMSCYGYERKTTPNLDKFAGNAILFENHYSAASWTLPSHLSLLSSTFPSCNQRMHPLSRPDRDIHMLAEILKTAGFYNYAYTTWIYVSPVYGFDLGFDRFNYIPKMEGEKLTDRYLSWLGKNKGLLGFHFLHYWDPHYPYTPERKYETHWQKNEKKEVAKRIRKNLAPIAEKYRDRIGLNKLYKTVSLYDSEILYTDHTLGRIFDELKSLGLYDKTMIIVTSDHGDEFWEHGGQYHEKTVYNEIIHVPLIIKLPGSEAAGTRIHIPVSQLDVMPTILDYLGKEQPKQTQGKSLLPLIRGGRMSEKRVIVSETTQKVTNQKFAFVNRNHHYIYSKKLGEKSRTDNQNEELFDISKDPLQQNDISTERKDILKRLRAFKDNFIELMKPFYLIRHRFSKMLLDENTIEMLRRNGYLGY